MDEESDVSIMREHIEKVHNETLCDQNALMAYTYNDGIQEDGYYNPAHMNIGDYIQSIAARQFLPRIDCYIDRDRLGLYSGKPANMLMNAFYYPWKDKDIFPKNIRTLLTSIHFPCNAALSKEVYAYFKNNEPVGCRDLATRDFLRRNGIRAYFSACLTLTLGATFARDTQSNSIYFVDYRFRTRGQEKIDVEVKKILNRYKSRKIRHYSHTFPLTMNIEQSIMQAEKLLEIYSSARLVVTTRLHCALPCLAMGVPVILIVPKYDHLRYNGLVPFLNFIGENMGGAFSSRILFDESGDVCNSHHHESYAAMLKELCHEFMKTKSVTLHSHSNYPTVFLNEQPECYVRNGITNKIRNFFYKKTLDEHGYRIRILKTLNFNKR